MMGVLAPGTVLNDRYALRDLIGHSEHRADQAEHRVTVEMLTSAKQLISTKPCLSP